MNGLTLKQLEAFCAVADLGSFTEAAERLYVSQSTVSTHVAALERSLNAKLLDRGSKKRLSLTGEGRRVYAYAKDVLSKCEALETSLASGGSRELLIGASTVPTRCLLPEQILLFSQRHPECRCVVRSGGSEAIQKLVLDGDVQLGFVGSTDNRQSLEYYRIAEDHLVLIAPNTPRFAKLKAKGTPGRELLTEPLIFRDFGSGTQRMIDNYLSGTGLDAARLNVKHYAADPELLQELVARGGGVSVVSALSAEDRLREERLIAFELEETPVKRNIYLACRRRSELSELAGEFMQQVLESAAQG